MARPNILYIHSHDTGRYIQPYGYAVETPNFQRIAEAGVLFRQAFSAAPTCSPSRAALLTGQCAHSAGMLGLAHRGWGLADYKQHIVHTLRDAGYRSTLIGVQHIAPDDDAQRIGYDEIITTENRTAAVVTPEAVKFLRRKHEKPFFLSVGFIETHREFPSNVPKAQGRYIRPPAPVVDTPETRHDMAGFVRSALIYDEAVGRVLDALEAAGLADDTLVISTTDHGIAFPGMKCTLTDHGTGVMLMMRGPGGFSGGRVIDAMVSQVDVFPTLCEFLGIDRPAWLQGTSMMPLVRGEADEINDEVYSEVTYHAAYEPKRAVRTRRWKYIRRFGDRDRPVLSNIDRSPSKTLWIENGWGDRPVAEEYLFDLLFDPNEAHNIAGEERSIPVLEDMRRRLDDWMQRTDDPIVAGPVPLVEGGRTNSLDEVDPS
ncbi:MAG: sulfatase [Planctomycetes bacterium]|nr:sulfatase [Planctomycetota bacterium]